jgi:hypothetical protein
MEWAFAGVYGPNRDAARRMMWEELAGLIVPMGAALVYRGGLQRHSLS